MVRGHMTDTGGSFPGGYFPNAYDIIAEGLCILPLRIIKGGVEDEDLMALIYNNVRWPDEMKIDSNAMIATTKFAENRIVDLIRRYGKDTVLGAVHEMMDRTEKAVRAEIAAMPDGTYTGEASTDDDGTMLDEPVTVRVDVTIKGDEITLDFSRSDEQRPGFVNCVYAVTYARAVAAVIIYMDPALADFHNAGSLRPIKVIAPPGTRDQRPVSGDGGRQPGQCRRPGHRVGGRGAEQGQARPLDRRPGASTAATTPSPPIRAPASAMCAPPSTTTAAPARSGATTA